MNKIKNSKIAIGTLSVITLMAIIYAAFTGQLNINGTANVRDSVWDIHIVESGQLEPSDITESARVLTKPTASSLSIGDFNLSLTTPGDYIEYTFHVVNEGDYDATLSDLDKAGVVCTANGSTSDPEAVKVCNKLEYTLKYDNGSTVAEGDTILSKETQTMVLKIKYQEFNDPSLLPTTNVSISGLGINISYSQSGNAKVNPDGTTPYVKPLEVGDEITVANESYHIISVPTNEDYVVALKDEPLTVSEITVPQGVNVSDMKGDGSIGGVTYGSNSTYDTSNIKSVVESWSLSKFINGVLRQVDGYMSRLITLEELITFGYVEEPAPWNSNDIWYPINNNIPNWLYSNYSDYWSMSAKSTQVWYVANLSGGGNNYNGSISSTGFGATNAVRPVINVYKSKIQN